MGTKILTDIQNDLKLLITAISGFKEGDEGFQICEHFAISQIKYHRYLSVNSHVIKNEIKEITKKFLIHGKYDVANEFQELIKSFLTSFDFKRHPQYDVQWSLLSLVLNLSNEINKSELSSISQQYQNCSKNVTITDDKDKSEEIDWGQYLKEGQEDFVCNYKSGSDTDYSDDENDGELELVQNQQNVFLSDKMATNLDINTANFVLCKPLKYLSQEITSKIWLKNNIQNSWWNELDLHQYKVDSQFESAYFYENWKRNTLKSYKIVGTISEYEACRELLWMFHIKSTMIPFYKECETEFFLHNFSIPSLTTVAFKSILLSYYQYITMMREMETFLEKLFKQRNLSSQNYKPSLTCEAYAVALQQELLNIKRGLIESEIQIMKQENQNTFLFISKMLKRYWNRMKIIFEIHKTVNNDWEKLSNWQCASKLLSNLYLKMQNSSNYETINLCASLYFASISVYLNIIDVWLTEGRLEDWREEFIFYRCNETIKSITEEDISPLQGFTCRKLDSLCLQDPIMKVLLHKVFQMGQSVELLVTLDRISDLWYKMDQEKVLIKTLNEECLKEILLECHKYNFSNVNESIDSVPLSKVEISIPQLFNDNMDQNIMQQVSVTNNPFLTKALENFLLPELNSNERKSLNESTAWKKHSQDYSLFEFLSVSQMVLPWKKIFECVITKVLEFKFSRASKLVKDILTMEYKLEVQLKLMRSVYMMETSHIMNKFCKIVFTQIESNGMWNNPQYVSCLLEEVLSQEWPDSTSRWSLQISNIRTTKVLEAIDGITLLYAAGWPINLILNEEALDKYNKIFRFELKLKWALWTLNTLRFDDLEDFDGLAVPDIVQHFHIRRLESLRFWLLHAIGSLHAYLSGQVLQSLSTTLEKALTQADTLEAIVTIHTDYLNNIQEHCLQTEKFENLIQIIYKLLEMCQEIRDKWKPESLLLIGKVLDRLESDYVKYHTCLALGLHNAVQHKDADYHKLLFPIITSLKNKFCLMKFHITDFGRNILNEVAYQSFPPSGIYITFKNNLITQEE